MNEEVRFDGVSFRYPEAERNVFRGLALTLPKGVVSLVGQNGTGKSTLLLLAGGVLVPTRGKVYVRGRDTAELRDERQRHRYVSFIYQNLEFETEECVGDLLIQVCEQGYRETQDEAFIERLVEIFELASALGKKTQELSKGQLQRTILAFSLLYGSRIIMMDEPIFALEDYQKKRVMEFLCEYARETGTSIYYSVHELEISQRYSDHILLFPRGGVPSVGPTSEVFTRTNIEEAYEVPFTMLKRREALFRQLLIRSDALLRPVDES